MNAGEWGAALREAARHGRVDELRELLARMPPTATTDAASAEGQTALMFGSWNARITACELLLAAGANPDQRDRFGCNARCFGRVGKAARGLNDLLRGEELLDSFSREAGAERPRPYNVQVRVSAKAKSRAQVARVAKKEFESKLAAAGLPVPRWRRGQDHGLAWFMGVERDLADECLKPVGGKLVGYVIMPAD